MAVKCRDFGKRWKTQIGNLSKLRLMCVKVVPVIVSLLPLIKEGINMNCTIPMLTLGLTIFEVLYQNRGKIREFLKNFNEFSFGLQT